MNYSVEEYATDIVYNIMDICEDENVPHPTIVSESGRAIVAYHSVLIFNVLGVAAFGEEKIPESLSPDEAEQPVIDLLESGDQPAAVKGSRTLCFTGAPTAAGP